MSDDVRLPASLRKELADASALQATLNAVAQNAPQVTPIEALPLPTATATAPIIPGQATPAAPAPTPPAAPAPATLADFIATQKEMIDTLRKASAPPPPPAAPAPTPRVENPVNIHDFKPTVTEKEKETFGDEVLQMMDRKVNELATSIRSAFNELHGRLLRLEQTTTRASAQAEVSVQQAFFVNLARMVPDFKEINEGAHREAWVKWLQGRNPGSRDTRQQLLNEASANYDAELAAEFFNAYKETAEYKSTVPAPAVAAARSNQPSLESQVVPDTTNAAAPAVPQEAKPIIMESQVKLFYADLAKGKYRGKEDEANAIVLAIDEAVREGRVRQGV